MKSKEIVKNYKVEMLHLWNENIYDITILRNLKNLKHLDISLNNITDISPLRELKNLERLDLSYNPIEEDDIEELRNILPNCSIYV